MIIEGSDQLEKGWKEYEFLYKPGNKSSRLPVVGTSSVGIHSRLCHTTVIYATISSTMQHR